jgi:hypothetical protein
MTQRLITADTSLVVPSLVSWHECHADARRAISDVSRLPGHVMCETISVLTRLPHGLAVQPSLTVKLLAEAFPDDPLVLDAPGHTRLFETLATYQIHGKTVFDALVGATAAAAGAVLRTRDQRARRVYEAVGARAEYI